MDFEKVKEIIVETLSCDADKVTPDARLAEDLEADSLAAVEGSYLGQAFNGCVLSQEEAVQQILSYTREQVVEAAGRLRLAAVYTLKGGAQHG